MSKVQIKSALVIEDDRQLSRSLCNALSDYADDVKVCNKLEDARTLMAKWHPQLLLLDFKLPDGDALELLADVNQRSPCPITIAMSAYARPEQTFDLSKLGVRAYLQKPFELDDLEKALEQALTHVPDVTPHIRNAVGSIGLKELESQVRETMLEEALSRTGGSRRGAAKMLQVSRQFIQHVIRKLYDR